MAPSVLRRRSVLLSTQPRKNLDGFVGINSLDLTDDDVVDIVNLSNVEQTTIDKITFTVMALSIVITGFVIGRFPHYYYLFHTGVFLVIYAHRIAKFTNDGYQYLLIHLCYWVNILTLIYAWTSSSNGYLFTGLFFLANGPVIWSIPCMRNSLVPHSFQKMFCIYIHVNPALTLLGIKWNSGTEQQFALCPHPDSNNDEACNEVGWKELYCCAIVTWFLWMALYFVIVEVLRADIIKKNELMTFFRLLVIEQRSVVISKFCSLLPGHKKALFYMFEFVFMLVTILPVYLCYHWTSLHILNVAFCFLVACYNGATFYIDVIGRKYYESIDDKLFNN